MECDGGQIRQWAALPWRCTVRHLVGKRDFNWCKISRHVSISSVEQNSFGVTTYWLISASWDQKSEMHSMHCINSYGIKAFKWALEKSLKHKTSSWRTENSIPILGTYSGQCERLSSDVTVSMDHELWSLECGGGLMLCGSPQSSSPAVTVFKFKRFHFKENDRK